MCHAFGMPMFDRVRPLCGPAPVLCTPHRATASRTGGRTPRDLQRHSPAQPAHTHQPEKPMAADTDPTRTALTDAEAAAEAHRIITNFATSFRDQTPVPTIGQAQPVPQPGRVPMSQKAVDDSVRMLSAGVASLPIGGMTALVLHVLGTVDPTQLAIGAAAPTALVLAVSALLKRAKAVLPDEHHHHYDGPVYQDQRNVNTTTKGVWAKTNNQP